MFVALLIKRFENLSVFNLPNVLICIESHANIVDKLYNITGKIRSEFQNTCTLVFGGDIKNEYNNGTEHGKTSSAFSTTHKQFKIQA